MEQEIVVNTRSKFNSKIKELFILHLLRTDMSMLINTFRQLGMFKVLGTFFYTENDVAITVRLQ